MSAWSNNFHGKPLTVENMAAVLSDLMRGQVPCQPDRLVVDIRLMVQYFTAEVAHYGRLVRQAEKRLASALTSSRYGQRRRQIAEGVRAQRAVKREEARRMLPRWRATLAHFTKELEAVTAEQVPAVSHTTTESTGPLFFSALSSPFSP